MQLVLERPRPYAFAVAAVLAAAAVRFVLDPLLGEHLPFYVFYFAVIAASLWGGLGAGLTALFLGFITAAYFFAFPRYSISFGTSEDMLGAFRFLSIGAALVIGGSSFASLRKRWLIEAQGRKQERERAEQATKEQERTHAALASIGDGLIIVDAQGRVTFLNDVARELSGWDIDEAVGRPITDVFRIVQGDTRHVVPDPSLRALHEGRTVTLPAGTLLLARDGRERWIDDSAAPIRDEQGRISGSVLVFKEVLASPGANAVLEDAVELVPAPSEHVHLTAAEREELLALCREWLRREWTFDGKASRMIALGGYELIVRQLDPIEDPAAGTSVRFLVVYERMRGLSTPGLS